ncbi:MAG: peptide chain release factor N(5)-glutamine methyltransferase [Thermoanaerobacteraceae bacterium]|nr:peptide chain release factor N(5)-glutamine methyltransferase [Thermoanaerobacteraceae bacterium]
MNVREALNMGRKQLYEAGVASPALDSQLILSHVLGTDRIKLFVYDEINLTKKQQERYEILLAKRCRFVPIAYIIGRKEFYGLNFYIKRGVLIPRPETEFVVEEALNTAGTITNPVIADLCCGSGAISVAIAVNNKKAKVYAIEISDVACEVARRNINAHDVQDRVLLLKGDLWMPLEQSKIKELDIIVSNPPYIPTQELKSLPNDVKNEPQLALDGGSDGLEFYRRIIPRAPEFLKKPGGRIIFEIGWDQASDVKDILEKSGFKQIKVRKDYADFDRVITGVL